MPVINVTEEAKTYDLDVQNLSVEDQRQVLEFEKSITEKFDPEKHYYIQYDKNQNNKIIALIGLPVEAEQFIVPSSSIGVAKVDIDEQKYEILKLSTTSKDLMTFYDEEKDEIFYRRLYFEIIEGIFDPNDFTFYNDGTNGEKNKIKIKVYALDSNDDPADDIQEIHGKILRAGGDAMPIPKVKILDKNNNELPRKFIIKPGDEITIDVSELDIDAVTIRFKAYVPNIDKWWLSMYPRFKKID